MCDRMMRKGQRKSAAVYLAAAVLMMCCLTQTIDCYRLRKKERREESDSTKVSDVQEGRIIFGSVFKKATGVNAPVSGETKKPSNASSEDDASYQADSPGWSGGDVQHRSSREAAWKRMSPSLLCGGDQLKFSAEGLGASQFAVEKGNEPPIPLSQVPQSCGYGMQKNSLGLILLVPYDGCNMVVEDGRYVLPLRWHGIPVSLLCHKLASASTAAPEKPQPPTPWNSPSYPLVPLPNGQNPQMPPPNGQKPQPHVIYPQIQTPDVMYPQMQPPHVRHPQMVLPHLIYSQMLPEGMPPLTQEDIPQTPLKLGLDMPLMEDDVPLVPLEMPLIPRMPRMHSDQNGSPPKIPQSYFFLPYANYPSVPEPSRAPIATTAEKPEMPKRPLYPPFYHPYYSNFPHPVPVTSAPTATAKPAPRVPQMFPFPMHPSFPWSGLPPQPTEKPTLPATRPQPQYFPFPHSYEYSAPKPETTTTKPQFAYMPFPYQSFPPRMVRPHPATMIKN